MNKPFIIHHANCTDGYCAAFIAAQYFNFDVELHPATYGDLSPKTWQDYVYILDFSYPREQLEDLWMMSRQLIVLDHHKTAEENLKGLDYCKFDMSECGASLTYKHFYPNKELPWQIQYIRDSDLYLNQLPNHKEICAYIHSIPFDIESYKKLFSISIDRAEELGSVLLRQLNKQVEIISRNAFEARILGHECVAVNVMHPLTTMVLNYLIDKYNKPAIGFNWIGKEWKYSMRSRDHLLDVRLIAEQFPGGGGHRNAASFNRTYLLDFKSK